MPKTYPYILTFQYHFCSNFRACLRYLCCIIQDRTGLEFDLEEYGDDEEEDEDEDVEAGRRGRGRGRGRRGRGRGRGRGGRTEN